MPASLFERKGRLCSFCARLAAAAQSLAGCGYNTLQKQDEQVTAAWSEVLNQYQRRADLVPNLVNTVKGAVAAEKDILDSVVEARAKATSIQATPELINDPQAFQQWQAAQGELSSGAVATDGGGRALSRSQVDLRTSAICRRSSRAPRTASPSRASATSRRCRTTTSRCASSRPT